MLVNQPPLPVPVDVPVPPYRLSGTVLGVVLNHRAALAALGDAVHRPPHKGPPRTPVLTVKPPNTWVASGGRVPVPVDAPALEFGVTLAAVIGRPACRVAPARALDHVAGWLLVADLCVPHASLYRPALRWRARDGFCPLGAAVVPARAVPDPDALSIRVAVDDRSDWCTDTSDRERPFAQLIADVSAFMTLGAGDLLMLGASHGSPLVGAGRRVVVSAPGLAPLAVSFVAEAAP